MCATIALSKAEDESFEGDTASGAIRVVENCLEALASFEGGLDAWYVKEHVNAATSGARVATKHKPELALIKDNGSVDALESRGDADEP